jgi:hypothetical protein
MSETHIDVAPADDPRWKALAAPFDPDQIELKPQALSKDDRDRHACKAGTQASADGIYCSGYHVRAVHLHYVGHAGITARLDEVDPHWNWEPMARTDKGLPLIDNGILWIYLTVLGVTRIGLGDAGGRTGPQAAKEIVGDAIRNGAMRFGVAVYLWSKSKHAAELAAGVNDDEPTQDEATPDESAGREDSQQHAPGHAAQLTQIAILLNQKRGARSPQAKHAELSTRFNRKIESAKELTPAEVKLLLTELRAMPDYTPATTELSGLAAELATAINDCTTLDDLGAVQLGIKAAVDEGRIAPAEREHLLAAYNAHGNRLAGSGAA